MSYTVLDENKWILKGLNSTNKTINRKKYYVPISQNQDDWKIRRLKAKIKKLRMYWNKKSQVQPTVFWVGFQHRNKAHKMIEVQDFSSKNVMPEKDKELY